MFIKLFGLTTDQITSTIEECGYAYEFRGKTIRVCNESRRRCHGEIFPCRDGGWSRRLEGNAVRIWESLTAIGTANPPEQDGPNYAAIGRAIRDGNASALYSEEEIADALLMGFASANDAANQDT